ncbi:MAG: AAA family ATPase, partial [Phycicoccus sp.]
AKTWAISQGRDHVVPDDVKLLAAPVLGHRLLVTAEAQFAGVTVDQLVGQVIGEVAPPTDRVPA